MKDAKSRVTEEIDNRFAALTYISQRRPRTVRKKYFFLEAPKVLTSRRNTLVFHTGTLSFLMKRGGKIRQLIIKQKICEITRYTRLGFRGETGENRGFFSSMEGGGGGGGAAAEKGKGKGGGHLLFQNALPSLPYFSNQSLSLCGSPEKISPSPPSLQANGVAEIQHFGRKISNWHKNCIKIQLHNHGWEGHDRYLC